jgi:hypothetical protein
MRGFGHFLLIGILAAVSLRAVSTASSPAQAPAKDANAILAQAREALGGEKRLSAVKNFVATGRTRQVRGDNLVPIEFEIAVELPDKYVRKDEIPAQESGPTATGFNGSELIQLPVPAVPVPPGGDGRAGGPPAPNPAQMEAMKAARVAAVKQDFVRLTLGMFAGSFSSYPLTFTYVGQAEAPQGKADVIEAKAPPNFTMRLFVNSETHLPIMVSWQGQAGRGGPGRGGPGGPGGPGPGPAPEGRGAAARPGATPPAAPGATPAEGAATQPARPAAGGAPAPPAGAPQGAAQGAPAQGAPAQGAPPQGAARGVAPAGGQQPPGGAPAAGPGRGGPPPAPVEFRIYYADYRDVDGMQWPFRLRRATGADTTEETTFDRFRVNTKIDAKKFEVRK